MNWKNRLTNYNFWVSIVSAVLLILQALKIKVDFIYVNEVSTAILGLLVVIGIINDPTKSTKNVKSSTEQTKGLNKDLNTLEIEKGVLIEKQNELQTNENVQKNLKNIKNEAKNIENCENSNEILNNLQKNLCKKIKILRLKAVDKIAMKF